MIRVLRAYLFFIITTIRIYIYFRFIIKNYSQEIQLVKKAKLWRRVGTQSTKVFAKLGGIYIKLGQFLSNAAHLFPDEFLEPLQSLQDKVPPQSFSFIKKRFINEWNLTPDSVFEEFDIIPIASASTAQVHKAVFQGSIVAVKVLYPGIENSVERDMQTIFQILKWLHKLILPMPYKEIHKQMNVMFNEEMDLRLELNNLEKMRYLFRDEPTILIPRAIKELSTKGILVTEFIQGQKWISAPQVKSSKEPKSRYVDILIRAYLLMVFRFRFFHADPHPGNIFITEDGRICLLDFGAVGKISIKDEEALVVILSSAMEGNSLGILEGLDRMNILKNTVDRKEILGLIEYSINRIQTIVKSLDNFRNIPLDSEGLREDLEFIKKMKTGLRDIVRALNLPSNYISLQRTADLLIGNIAWIDPYRSIFDYSEKPFREMVLREKVFFWRVLPSKD